MRPPWIGLVILIATLVGNTTSGHAYSDSFFNKRYCTMGGGGRSGAADCSYNTWEQCRASASGLGRYCSENPFWQPEAGKERTPRRRTGQQ
jgi:hypothetical protein